jgi:hypothetical protein
MVITAIVIARNAALDSYIAAWTKDPEDKNLWGLSRGHAFALRMASLITGGIIGALAVAGMIGLTDLM